MSHDCQVASSAWCGAGGRSNRTMSRAGESHAARWLRRAGLFSSYTLVQFVVHAMNAAAGFLVIRSLGKMEYAWFTVACGISAMLSGLMDAGIGSTVTSVGGTVWRDRRAHSALIAVALRFRLRLLVLAVLITTPVSLWLLFKNGATTNVALLFTLLVLIPVVPASTAAILNDVNRLHSRNRQLQTNDLAFAGCRLGVIILLMLTGCLTVATALTAALAAQFLQYVLVRRQVLPLFEAGPDVTREAEFTQVLSRRVRHMYPNCLFIVMQGQISWGLISIFASSSEVADLGALTRLAILFTVFTAPVAHWLTPAFARATSHSQQVAIFSGTCALFGGLMALILGFSMIWPHALLSVLGTQYLHLHKELPLVLFSMGLNTVVMVLWGLNLARGWSSSTWVNIPVTLGVQILALCWLPVNSVAGVSLLAASVAGAQVLHAVLVAVINLRKQPQPLTAGSVSVPAADRLAGDSTGL